MPVLARTLEARGLATLVVTNMPFWAERVGTPRTLAVEFPFGHALGQAHDATQQMRVLRQALEVLEMGQAPGSIVHSGEVWPEPAEQASAAWQPAEPSPLIHLIAPRMREILRQRRHRS